MEEGAPPWGWLTVFGRMLSKAEIEKVMKGNGEGSGRSPQGLDGDAMICLTAPCECGYGRE
jgi:hypothetical protein